MTAHELARLLLAGPDHDVAIAMDPNDEWVGGISEIQTAKWPNDEQIGQHHHVTVLVRSQEMHNDIELVYDTPGAVNDNEE